MVRNWSNCYAKITYNCKALVTIALANREGKHRDETCKSKKWQYNTAGTGLLKVGFLTLSVIVTWVNDNVDDDIELPKQARYTIHYCARLYLV